jgi:hypothetical protein
MRQKNKSRLSARPSDKLGFPEDSRHLRFSEMPLFLEEPPRGAGKHPAAEESASSLPTATRN